MKCAAAWKKLVSRLVLQPLDESLTSDAAAGPVDDRPDFDTQESADLRDSSASDDGLAGFAKQLSQAFLTEQDQCIVRGTWPWAFAREIAFLPNDKNPDSRERLAPLLDFHDKGPICCLACATLLSMESHSDVAAQFASLGLKSLSLADFRNDYRSITDQRTLSGKSLLALADGLRSLSNDESAALCSSLPPAIGHWLSDFCAAMRCRPNAPIAEAVAGALDSSWESTWREQVRSVLKTTYRR